MEREEEEKAYNGGGRSKIGYTCFDCGKEITDWSDLCKVCIDGESCGSSRFVCRNCSKKYGINLND